ncbi:DUF4340 domain-containing protein [Methylosarcina fibrata]|uniref:DUF4340 domain-containing protein n=1 Tax=Methylosarcina fibrata TaxID=105972 RepID=UPI00036B4200|nr:DUF4340 domain-containing protein [Methylosarcina fibrata]
MNHINTKVLSGLAVAAVVAIGAAVLVSSSREPASESSDEVAYALPELRGHLNDVKTVGLIAADNKPAVTLENGGTGWTVSEKEGYPADTGKLRGLLLNLANARLLEEKTAQAERYSDLGVEDVSNKDAKGILVKLEGLTGPSQLIVGNTSSHGGGTFVRRPGDRQSWLAQGQIRIDRDPIQWVDTVLTDIPSERIAEIALNQGQGKMLRLFRQEPGNGNFRVADLPKGREPAAPDVVGGLASTLSGLKLEDVIAAKTHPQPDGAPKLQGRYRTFDGVTVHVTAWLQDGRHYASFSAALDQAAADKAIRSEQDKAKAGAEARQKAAEKESKPAAKTDTAPAAPPAVQDPAKYRQQRLDELNAEIAHLNRRFQDRHFVIPDFKYANMDKSPDDVLKPLAATQTPLVKIKAKKPAGVGRS